MTKGPLGKPGKMELAAHIAEDRLGIFNRRGVPGLEYSLEKYLPRWAGSIAIAAATAVLIGWIWDVDGLKRLGLEGVAMNPTTASCFILLGTALLLPSATSYTAMAWARNGLSGVALLVGMVKFVDLAGGSDSGIDRMILPSELAGPYSANLNPIAPNTAVNFVLTGLAMMLSSSCRRTLILGSQTAAFAAILLSSMGIIGYTYGALNFYHVSHYFPMAFDTACTFVVVSAGVLWIHPDDGVMAVIRSGHSGGVTVRRLLPAIVLLPFLLGLAWLTGVHTRIFDPVNGVAAFVTANICVLAILVLRIGSRLNRSAANLAERTVALEEATRRADAASQAKSSFLANMSHEIRTPMNGVLGMLEVLGHTGLDEQQTRIVATIDGSARSLLQIIDDILDFSKIEAGRLRIEAAPSDLAELVEGTTRLFLGAAAAKGIYIRCFVSPMIRGRLLLDPLRVRQILSNLVSNATKFTATGGVTLTAELQPHGGDAATLRLAVADTGIGISSEDKARLFTPFEQAHSSTARGFGGTGLGLSICRRLAELMGGQIELTSMKWMGTTVTLTLPVRIEPAAPGHSRDFRGLDLVLITNDDVERKYIASYFTAWGANIRLADMLGLGAVADAKVATVILAPRALERAIRSTLAAAGARLPSPLLRFVFFSYDGEAADETHATENTIVTTALSRTRLVTAVAVAAGMESPEHETASAVAEPGMIESAPDRERALARGHLLLLAEDHPVNREVVVRQLHLLGYAVDAVEDGAAALAAIERTPYAVVLTDCNMPNLDGFELTRRIRTAGAPWSRVPIIALTANAMEGEALRCQAAGMSDYLPKPIRMSVLRDCLTRWLPPAIQSCSNGRGRAEEPGAAQDHDVLDLSILAEYCDDETELVATLRSYAKSLHADLDALTAAVAAKDLKAIAQTAHRMKGAARFVGAQHINAAGEILESQSDLRDWPAVDAQAKRLVAASEQVSAAIARQIEERSTRIKTST